MYPHTHTRVCVCTHTCTRPCTHTQLQLWEVRSKQVVLTSFFFFWDPTQKCESLNNKAKCKLSLQLKHSKIWFWREQIYMWVCFFSPAGLFQPVRLAALQANSLWRYYGYWKACKPLSLYLQEKEKRVLVSAWGRARSWYGCWPHCKWWEQFFDQQAGGTSGPICSKQQTTPQLHNCAH